MSNPSNVNKNEVRKQKLKKYTVFGLMFLLFVGCLWLIFSPSESDKKKERDSAGFNVEIPDPADGELIGDKRDAYEQERFRQNKNEKMRSLNEFSSLLDRDNDSTEIKKTVLMEDDLVENDIPATPIQSSANAYRDINRSLGSFYEEPKEDPDKKKMEEKIFELENRLNEQDASKKVIDDQLELMEKSYQLAAKYMPNQNGDYPFEQSKSGLSAEEMKNKIIKSSNKKANITPVTQFIEKVVSSLPQQYSSDDIISLFDRERNIGFYNTEIGSSTIEKNTISACIHEEQTVIDGQSVKIRITEPLYAGKTYIPENTVITGNARIQGERLQISINSIEYQGLILGVELSVYDSDGQMGINIPGSMEMEAIKEVAANMGSYLNSTINISQQSAGQQLATDLGRGVIQGASQYIQKKIRTVKVTLKTGYKVMLLPNQNI